MVQNLYGNPHSENTPAKLSGEVVDGIRLKTLEFLGADPEHFDFVFVANATAAIKLVGEAFRDIGEKTKSNSFWYGYHKDAHTSIVGVREWTYGQFHCFENDAEVDGWLRSPDASVINRHDARSLGLFAYPGQSNLSGRRLPLRWAGHMRQTESLQNTYTLLDAAALAMTFPMARIFKDPEQAPDFTCLSLYKIFGFPDVGALVVRKDSGHILTLRKYFGGGTVTAIGVIGDVFHRTKGHAEPPDKIHESLEDGTLPFHSILALGEAIDVHKKLYTSMEVISGHTSHLVVRLRRGLGCLRYDNGRPVCRIYNENNDMFEDETKQGSVIAFNVLARNGHYVPYADVERLANAAGIYIRSGGWFPSEGPGKLTSCRHSPLEGSRSLTTTGPGVCNPGGIVTLLGYEPWMLQRALSAGHSCGSDSTGVLHRLPTG